MNQKVTELFATTNVGVLDGLQVSSSEDRQEGRHPEGASLSDSGLQDAGSLSSRQAQESQPAPGADEEIKVVGLVSKKRHEHAQLLRQLADQFENDPTLDAVCVVSKSSDRLTVASVGTHNVFEAIAVLEVGRAHLVRNVLG